MFTMLGWNVCCLIGKFFLYKVFSGIFPSEHRCHELLELSCGVLLFIDRPNCCHEFLLFGYLLCCLGEQLYELRRGLLPSHVFPVDLLVLPLGIILRTFWTFSSFGCMHSWFLLYSISDPMHCLCSKYLLLCDFSQCMSNLSAWHIFNFRLKYLC